MVSRKKKKAMVFFALTLSASLVVTFALISNSHFQQCGYSISGGFRIPCSCVGFVRTQPDQESIVSRNGYIEYCFGLAETQVCFKQFDEQKPAKPYLCSDYPYELTLETPSSTQSRPLYPDSKYAYDAKLSDGSQVVLETQQEAACQRLKVQGFAEKISIGGTSPTYQGFHLYAVDFVCLE